MEQKARTNQKNVNKIPILTKEKITDAIELDFTITNGVKSTTSIHLKGDQNSPTLALDFSNNQLLLPYKNFAPESTKMVTCTEAQNCKMVQDTTQITYKDSTCTGNIASGTLNFSNQNRNLVLKIFQFFH